jgi:hypothetical protein
MSICIDDDQLDPAEFSVNRGHLLRISPVNHNFAAKDEVT